MPLQITDKTAGVLLLTIDNTGLICFGNGTPVSAVTVGSVAVIDTNGNITNERAVSTSFTVASGSVAVAPGEVVTVTTLSGFSATVQLDATWPCVRTVHNIGPPDTCVSTDVYTTPSHTLIGGQQGKFTVVNHVITDDTGFCANPVPDTVTYRWM